MKKTKNFPKALIWTHVFKKRLPCSCQWLVWWSCWRAHSQSSHTPTTPPLVGGCSAKHIPDLVRPTLGRAWSTQRSQLSRATLAWEGPSPPCRLGRNDFQEPEMWKPQHSFTPGCRTSRTQTLQPEHTSQLPVVKFHMFENSSSPVGDVTFHANFMPLFSYEHTCNPPWLTGKASWLTAGRLLTVHHSKRRGMCNEIIKSRRKTYLEPASDHRWVLLGKRRCV